MGPMSLAGPCMGLCGGNKTVLGQTFYLPHPLQSRLILLIRPQGPEFTVVR